MITNMCNKAIYACDEILIQIEIGSFESW